jgi:phytoene dehydrogenase-like protein
MLYRWFESEPLISTLATDSIIGAMCSPNTPGSSYVLLHHGKINNKESDGRFRCQWSMELR